MNGWFWFFGLFLMCRAFINQEKNRLNIQTAFTFTNSQSYLLSPNKRPTPAPQTRPSLPQLPQNIANPHQGRHYRPKKNGAKPSRADADPAFCLSLFIASADMAGNTSPIKNSMAKKPISKSSHPVWAMSMTTV